MGRSEASWSRLGVVLGFLGASWKDLGHLRMMMMRRRRRGRKRKNRSRRRKGEQEEEGEQKGQRSLECLSEPLGIYLGSFLEASWDVLGVSWRS